MRPSDLVRGVASLAAPPRCAICAAGCEWREVACGRCAGALRSSAPARRAVPGLDEVLGAAPYEGVARKLVASLKFGPRPALAQLAAEAIAAALGLPAGATAVVPVPAAPRRLARRGIDPAEEIAVALAARLGLAVSPCLARRSGRRQVGRARSERVASPPRVRCIASPPARALLVDDVFTTGATLAACARALREGGCERVSAVVLAVAPPGGRRVPRGTPRSP